MSDARTAPDDIRRGTVTNPHRSACCSSRTTRATRSSSVSTSRTPGCDVDLSGSAPSTRPSTGSTSTSSCSTSACRTRWASPRSSGCWPPAHPPSSCSPAWPAPTSGSRPSPPAPRTTSSRARSTARLLGRSVRYAIQRRRLEDTDRALYRSLVRAEEVNRLERALLPTPSVVDQRLEVRVGYRAGRDGVLGGDFYDVVERPDGSVLALVGDVCGHGPDEAALGATLRTAWRTLVLAEVPTVDILGLLERVLISERARPEVFTTVSMLDVAADRASVDLYLAGHPVPAAPRARRRRSCRRTGAVARSASRSPGGWAPVRLELAPVVADPAVHRRRPRGDHRRRLRPRRQDRPAAHRGRCRRGPGRPRRAGAARRPRAARRRPGRRRGRRRPRVACVSAAPTPARRSSTLRRRLRTVIIAAGARPRSSSSSAPCSCWSGCSTARRPSPRRTSRRSPRRTARSSSWSTPRPRCAGSP